MIVLMTEFAPWDIYSARVLAAYRSYFDMPDAQFWLQRDAAQRCTAAVSCTDGFAILAAAENADYEELAAFLQMQPWQRLQCDESAAKQLPFAAEWRSMFLRYEAPLPPVPSPLPPAMDPAAVYDILLHCFDDMKNRNEWMADLALRWRRNTAQSWVLDGQCTVSALAITETYAFLGAVGTLPAARGKGLAGQLLREAARQMGSREIWLACRKELQGFYEHAGFRRHMDMITLKKEV